MFNKPLSITELPSHPGGLIIYYYCCYYYYYSSSTIVEMFSVVSSMPLTVLLLANSGGGSQMRILLGIGQGAFGGDLIHILFLNALNDLITRN